jgi:single-stranded-DNA-specific exonuclease
LNYKRWIISESDPMAESSLSAGGIPEIAAKVLVARGIKSLEKARSLLNTDSSLIGNPMELSDMEEACSRIRAALEKGERIAVFGDYDVDGITAVSLLMSWLGEKGADCIYYIPDRIEEGYGISTAAVEQLADKGVPLISGSLPQKRQSTPLR